MFEGMQKIKDVLEHIEENITSDLDYKVLASKMGLSVYEFRRIFSFVIGLPIAEYIRKRRLSLAAFEITKNEQVDMLKLSEKYGYSSQSAFSKAFSEYHGIAPTVLMKEKRDITLLTVPKFDLKINASENINFSVIKREKFYIQGFFGVSSITDSCCCENVWNSFYDSGADKKIDSDRIFVSYKNEGENVLCTIGSLADELQRELPFEEIPESLWACFRLNTVEDEIVNEFYSKILYQWLPSANLVKNDSIPIVEVYPRDMSKDGFEWEIWLPIFK